MRVSGRPAETPEKKKEATMGIETEEGKEKSEGGGKRREIGGGRRGALAGRGRWALVWPRGFPGVQPPTRGELTRARPALGFCIGRRRGDGIGWISHRGGLRCKENLMYPYYRVWV